VVPGDAEWQIELRVKQQDVGRVQPGQPVRFKFDAFPFGEYGVLRGEVVRLLRDAEDESRTRPRAGNDGLEPGTSDYYYRAIATLEQGQFCSGGRRVEVRSGMGVTAEILTDRSSMLGLLLAPLLQGNKTGEGVE
jgi:hypothetical protein